MLVNKFTSWCLLLIFLLFYDKYPSHFYSDVYSVAVGGHVGNSIHIQREVHSYFRIYSQRIGAVTIIIF